MTVLELPAWTRPHLAAELDRAGVRLNDSARTLLADTVFDDPRPESVRVVELTVGDLDVSGPPVLSRLLTTARQRGLRPCPVATGPYLRLARPDQASAPDSVLSNGRAPSGSVTVLSEPLRPDDDDYPKGFYLRVIDGVPWLRGYRCSDAHVWSPQDRLALRAAD